MKEILLATSNQNKVQEFSKILEPFMIKVLSLKDLNDQSEVRENGQSFKENAFLKANYYYKRYQMPVIADDSGIKIAYFNDYPDILSARFMDHLDYPRRNRLILDIMKDIKDRRACFIAHLTFLKNGERFDYEGVVEGEIASSVKGDHGFVYDPIFYLPSIKKTMAELSEDEKNHVSHRALALKEFVHDIQENHIL